MTELRAHPRRAFRNGLWRAGSASMMAVAATSMLAISAVGQEPAPVAEPVTDCDVGGSLTLFTWDGYAGQGIPEWDALWADNGIDVSLRPVGNEDLIQVLKSPGGEAYDVFTINQGNNQRTYQQGVVSPIHVEEVPELGNMYPEIAENPIFQAEDGTYNAVPLTIGPLGINWVAERFPEGFTSYAQALDPQYRVSIFDDPLNTISTAAVAVGLDPAVLTRDELNGPVKDWLLALRPQLRVISPSLGDQLTALINDEVDLQLVGIPWNILQGAEQGVEIGFAIPSEGSYGYVDSIGITPWAPDRCNALVYGNAGMDPVLGALLNDSLVGLGATPEINANLAPETRALFPEDLENDFFAKLKWNVSHTDPDGPYATIDEWTELWNEIKVGG